jgi:hypothetical protein
LFFFEKKNQKTFIRYGRHRTHTGGPAAAGNEQKFFASFFKKDVLSSFSCFFVSRPPTTGANRTA